MLDGDRSQHRALHSCKGGCQDLGLLTPWHPTAPPPPASQSWEPTFPALRLSRAGLHPCQLREAAKWQPQCLGPRGGAAWGRPCARAGMEPLSCVTADGARRSEGP